MLSSLLAAIAIIAVIDLSAWRYGRDFMSLDRGASAGSYAAFLRRRIPIILGVLAALAFVMMDSRKSIYLRGALLGVMIIAYVVVTWKDLKDRGGG